MNRKSRVNCPQQLLMTLSVGKRTLQLDGSTIRSLISGSKAEIASLGLTLTENFKYAEL